MRSVIVAILAVAIVAPVQGHADDDAFADLLVDKLLERAQEMGRPENADFDDTTLAKGATTTTTTTKKPLFKFGNFKLAEEQKPMVAAAGAAALVGGAWSTKDSWPRFAAVYDGTFASAPLAGFVGFFIGATLTVLTYRRGAYALQKE
eukprot:gnl/TRDRNA2_/TRDRNA2_181288_c0_seq1.p1 gnl/TRDRNA2_/TRDRNA2_181288_c0~~gnl/TRDRNA2_/TRDRNA2_181288_c0_seq1.p1  ORF type:complete len:148 (-),score=29.83 gnl/TRDRNA2_/TRDRNA2_181288_c0_seq1:68-511(-)